MESQEPYTTQGSTESKQLHGDFLSKESYSRTQVAGGARAPSGARSHRARAGQVRLAVPRAPSALSQGSVFIHCKKNLFLK